jgi:outer membrane protein
MKHSFFFFLLLLCSPVFAQQVLTLEQAISLALEKDYNLQLAENANQAANTDLKYSIGGFLPRINGTANKLWNNNDQEQRLRRQDAPDTLIVREDVKSSNINASLQLNWTLFDGTRMFATRDRLEQITRQGELNVKDQMVNTIASVILSYYNIVQQKQQLRATQEQMYVNEERVKLADRKLAVGTGAKPELLQAKVDLNAQRTQVLQQETTIAQLKQQLNLLLGLRSDERYNVADSIEIDVNIPVQNLASSLETKNFTVQSFEKNILISQFALRERRAEYFPTLSFVGNYNYSETQNPVVINNFTPLYNQNQGYNYGFSLTVPILNNFNQRRLVQQAYTNVSRQRLLYNQQKAIVNINFYNAEINYQNSIEVLLIEEENILLAKENVTIALESFKRGVSTFIELRTAQQSLETAYNRLITARYNAKVAETELLRLSGELLK